MAKTKPCLLISENLQDGFKSLLNEASKEFEAWVDLYSTHICVPLERKTDELGYELQICASNELFAPSRI